MSTKEVLGQYFERLKHKQPWESLLAENFAFTSFVSPTKEVGGRSAYLEATRRFFSMIASVEVRDMIVDGTKACVLTRYELRSPAGAFHSDVAEVFTVRDGRIDSLGIYFDSSPFPK